MKKSFISCFIAFVVICLFNSSAFCMHNFTMNMTLMGTVVEVNTNSNYFKIECRSKEQFDIYIGTNTVFESVKNLDVYEPEEQCDVSIEPEAAFTNFQKNIKKGILVVVEGVYQEYSSQKRFDARYIYTTAVNPKQYNFEDNTRWYISQISTLADEWLTDLFGDTRNYKSDDFARFYRTNLNILGKETDNTIQECATLSRLIYGLSSAYLMTGNERYYLAAKAGVEFQQQTFRLVTHDGNHCFWAYGVKLLKSGTKLIISSQNKDDLNSIPLYEQIYALAGLTQYYRITADPEILNDIIRTVNTFNDFYRDYKLGGYYSHIDCTTFSYNAPVLGKNQARKNWNSIGDHIPAYLVNLILALDPLPAGRDDIKKFKDKCIEMLEMTSNLIVDKFPDPNPSVPYFNERFFADWTVDHDWGWQKNRAIIGHNLKIAWNLTRCANYFLYLQKQTGDQKYGEKAEKFLKICRKIGYDMAKFGIDKDRGGVYDIVERNPQNNMLLEFPWSNTKEFWQQEQGILAYLILHGATDKDSEFLQLTRELSMFWNLFFLDRDNSGVFFRVKDNGMPVISGRYANKAWHAISGYHAFELNYLAHIYTRTYVIGKNKEANKFCMYFKLSPNCGQKSINVLPDFVKPGDLEIIGITVNGIKKSNFQKDNFQILLEKGECTIMVEFGAGKKL